MAHVSSMGHARISGPLSVDHRCRAAVPLSVTSAVPVSPYKVEVYIGLLEYLQSYLSPLPTRAREPKNKTTTDAFAKVCNVVTAWTMADLAKVKLAISANGVAIGGRRYQMKIANNEL